ncbi:MAG: nitrogen fixation protein FixH [Halomonadaceae bacterium]|nr:MAG: nitrogen fixation protein FixH [Halomonadaceae bacterium]
MTLPEPNSPQPWYREPFAWLVLGIPAATIVWCIILYNIAVSQPVNMVSDDYYNDGMGINREVRRDRLASTLGISANITFTANGEIQILLESPRQLPWQVLALELIHPTLGDQDRALTASLQHSSEPVSGQYTAQYRVQSPDLMNGRWYLDLRDPENQWRLKGETTLPGMASVTLKPQRGPLYP